MVKVKICGITNYQDASAAVALGADALGFVFWKKSPRYVAPSVAARIIRKFPPFISCVGIFVDEKAATVKKIASQCKLAALQFHGEESPRYCRQFPQYKIIKAFRLGGAVDMQRVNRYDVDAYLFDAYRKNMPGGTGKVFDWNGIAHRAFKKPVILSGGLSHRNVKEAIRKVRPYAVDSSSSLEKAPGKKDIRLVRKFFRAVTL